MWCDCNKWQNDLNSSVLTCALLSVPGERIKDGESKSVQEEPGEETLSLTKIIKNSDNYKKKLINI